MAAKFYAGASMHATRTTAQQDKTAAVQRNSADEKAYPALSAPAPIPLLEDWPSQSPSHPGSMPANRIPRPRSHPAVFAKVRVPPSGTGAGIGIAEDGQ